MGYALAQCQIGLVFVALAQEQGRDHRLLPALLTRSRRDGEDKIVGKSSFIAKGLCVATDQPSVRGPISCAPCVQRV
jgi:hypothetical protein